ncbi:MAG TPA: hypothetical protein VD932_01060 [Aquabacterium sp.]|nr:hypothetical protein [Aquabacterium sp.]
MTDLTDDMLRGANAISTHTGETLRRTQYLLETRQLPAFKIGDRWCMRKSTYRKYVEDLEAAARAEMRLRGTAIRGEVA